MDISMDIHEKSVDMDMDMDVIFHIHGNPDLRSMMKEDRLNGLALMAVHKDVRFKHDDVITEYAATHNRRFNFQ